ncbi:ligninase H2 precursor [Colletotrichum tofieldiae]|uniref:Peroxidase n=1 Tax=Colletotrichum tofieldiae TaxID=708197 RepID=A0A166YQ18_9PEZI|nr:ligninase h2 precursor [Colletotrichum tofieldiae]GKT59636.1 ligninase h2 precursor [Colletotrichum tofieldiae]GKT78435.1 ligninase H2 precursor [Colletotrichum tofieldiae]
MARTRNAVALLTALAAIATAYPGMGRVPGGMTHDELVTKLGRSGRSGFNGNGFNGGGFNARAEDNEAIGDLLKVPDNDLSDVGRDVKGILTGNGNPVSGDTEANVPDLGSAECSADKCCVWKHVADELMPTFRDDNGCTDPARAAIRLGFHDAAGWSKGTGDLGGADGSIILAPEEIGRPANDGLEDIAEQMKVWHAKFQQFGAGMADLIQFAATTATVACPGGPRIKTFVGRKDSSVAAPDGLLPDPRDNADKLIELFGNKTITAPGLAALVGAHTSSRQRFFEPSRANAPQDTTPGIWDVLFYQQTLAAGPNEIVTFPSDIALSKDPRSGPAFRTFAEQAPLWGAAYAKQYLRLSLLGVFNINELTDCTKVLPAGTGAKK